MKACRDEHWYFVGLTSSREEIIDLLEEFDLDEDSDVDADDGPNCKLGEHIGFEWYDHDWADYEGIDRPIPPGEFIKRVGKARRRLGADRAVVL